MSRWNGLQVCVCVYTCVCARVCVRSHSRTFRDGNLAVEVIVLKQPAKGYILQAVSL